MLLLFVPDAQSMTPPLAESQPLAGLLPERRICRQTSAGPSGPGLLIADDPLPAGFELRYDAQSQKWQRVPDANLWVGYDAAHPPAPQSLARAKQLPGYPVSLLDGHNWLIPQLREWIPSDTLTFRCTLPRVIKQSEDTGEFVLGDVVPQYRAVWEAGLRVSDELFRQLTEGATAALDDAEVLKFCIDLLELNYRVNASVVSLLELLSSAEIAAIVQVAVDLDRLRDHLKNLLSRHDSGGTTHTAG